MKVCIIGTGSQGTGLAGLLAMEPDVESIILADSLWRNLEQALTLLNTLGNRKVVHNVTIRLVNAESADDVADVIRGNDIVFNAIIPRFNISIMKACIREKCHYLDLFAAPYEGDGVSKEETIGAQLELDDAFRKIGRTALPSIGMSPGWTSLAAEYMMDTMDEVEDVVIRWGDFVDTDELFAPISPITLIHEWFGAPSPLRTRCGKSEAVDLMDSEEVFTFPQPIGDRTIYTVTAHPDIVLIPRFSRKPIRICEEKGGFFMGNMSTKDIWIRCMQKAASKQGDASESANIMEEMSKGLIPPMEYGRLRDEGKIRDHAVCFSCEVTGRKDGASIRHICYYTSTLSVSLAHLPWASPAVYGTVGGMPIELVLMLGRSQITKTGVLSVGNLGIAHELNRAMAARGQILTEKIERTMGAL